MKLFAGHRAGIWGRLCSCRAFTAALGPGTGAGSEHQEHQLCAAVLPWVLQCCQGRAVPCAVNFGGKQLGFHLSRFMDKFTESCSSWLGLCRSSWTPIPTVVGPLLTLAAMEPCQTQDRKGFSSSLLLSWVTSLVQSAQGVQQHGLVGSSVTGILLDPSG